MLARISLCNGWKISTVFGLWYFFEFKRREKFIDSLAIASIFDEVLTLKLQPQIGKLLFNHYLGGYKVDRVFILQFLGEVILFDYPKVVFGRQPHLRHKNR